MEEPSYGKYLTPQRAGDVPAASLALWVEGRERSVRARRGRKVELLGRWRSAGWWNGPRGPEGWSECSGQRPAEWWRWVDQWLTVRGTLWVWTLDAFRAATLLGMWEKIESGEILIQKGGPREDSDRSGEAVSGMRLRSGVPGGNAREGNDGVVPSVRASGGGKAETGPQRTAKPRLVSDLYAVLGAPPFIVACRRAGKVGRLMMVGLENYGAPSLEDLPPGETPLMRVARWALRYCELVRGEWRGSVRPTAAGWAVSVLRSGHLTHAVHCHQRPAAERLERWAYLGGRAEAYRLGVIPGPVYHLDVRAMYPWVYSNYHLPCRLWQHECAEPTGKNLASCSQSAGIAEVVVETDLPLYPACRRTGPRGGLLPLALTDLPPDPHEERLTVYPVGRFRTVLCGPELASAICRGHVKRWVQYAAYKMSPWLMQFGQSMYQLRLRMRKEGDVAGEKLVKAAMVGVVGRLGMCGREWVPRPDLIAIAPYADWHWRELSGAVHHLRAIGWQVQEELVGGMADGAVCAAAAFITSFARWKMRRVFKAAGPENVYYTDTDAVFTNQAGYDRLRASDLYCEDALGHLRLVGRHDQCEIYGVKHYKLDGVVTCAGVRAVTGPVGPGTSWRWEREWVGSAMRQRCRPQVRSRLRRNERAVFYRHGSVEPDGRVLPLRLWEEGHAEAKPKGLPEGAGPGLLADPDVGSVGTLV